MKEEKDAMHPVIIYPTPTLFILYTYIYVYIACILLFKHTPKYHT